jgi:hypothetical protein
VFAGVDGWRAVAEVAAIGDDLGRQRAGAGVVRILAPARPCEHEGPGRQARRDLAHALVHVIGQPADHALRRAEQLVRVASQRRVAAADPQAARVHDGVDLLGELVGLVLELHDRI